MADINQVRVPPHSAEAEGSVLGALLLDKDAVTALLISPDVSGDDNDDGIAAVTFKYYASPEKYGRVVHLIILVK